MAWHTGANTLDEKDQFMQNCAAWISVFASKGRVRSPERHRMRIAWTVHNMRRTVFSLFGKCSGCTVVTRLGVVREPLRGDLFSDDLLVAEDLE